MAIARLSNGSLIEKAVAGQWSGCNSTKMAWLMPDTQYRWGINIVNRGGIPQTRPGYRLQLTLPQGNLQMLAYFKATKDKSLFSEALIFSVSGKVYYAPFPLTTPTSWEKFRFKNLQFNENAPQLFWEVAEKSLTTGDGGDVRVVPTYSILCLQDGVGPSGFIDGVDSAHLDENSPKLQLPTGTWMKWTGDRLWLARGAFVLASDLGDPIGFNERLTGAARSDFKFNGTVTGLASTTGTNRQSNLVVFTINRTETLLSSIRDRPTWLTTADFQGELYPGLGCIAGKSIIYHAGLLWWYSEFGLVSSDSAQANFLTSQIKYRDIEMGYSKRNFSPDLSRICGFSFENYLGESVPSGDTLNAHTEILDYAIANELYETAPPAWNGIWTGTRPIEWVVGKISGQSRCFQASVDYQALSDGSFNHIWEAFQGNRMDTYPVTDSTNAATLVDNRIYCMYEGKLLGDGMDMKRFKWGEVDMTEMGGKVSVKISVGGNKGAYHSLTVKEVEATLTSKGSTNSDLTALDAYVGPFKTQSRRITTQEPEQSINAAVNAESKLPDIIDKSFGLKVEWCGRAGIDSYRIFMEPHQERSTGKVEDDETGAKAVTQDGKSFIFAAGSTGTAGAVASSNLQNSQSTNLAAFVSPITPRYRDVFYSAIPVNWDDPTDECIVCLPCARETFSPRDRDVLHIDGQVVN